MLHARAFFLKDGHSILYGPWMLHARAFLKGMNIAF